jgi:hypothetical protein
VSIAVAAQGLSLARKTCSELHVYGPSNSMYRSKQEYDAVMNSTQVIFMNAQSAC